MSKRLLTARLRDDMDAWGSFHIYARIFPRSRVV